jgi:ribosomal protein S16
LSVEREKFSIERGILASSRALSGSAILIQALFNLFRCRAHPLPQAIVSNTFFRKARDAKPIEVLGTYDPIPRPPAYGNARPSKAIRIDLVRAKYWLGNGAQPSDTMWRLLSMVRFYISWI